MVKNLVIVESPAKAKTIEKFLGKDFLVRSSNGHIRDLAKKGLSVDPKNNFEPTYEVSSDKKSLVSELGKLSKDAEIVWLATDEDREGEAISWHLFDTLKLTESKTKRIVFHEITKPAILNAIENPRTIDINLVDAQQARRILDRLVGFELSPILWKKIKPSLSAGRVQSVAVRLIVEREREINNFTSTSSYKIVALFPVEKAGISAVVRGELPKRFQTIEEAEKFLTNCIGATFKIKDLETKPAKKSPAPPFTTSTLQQEASRKLGFSVSQTMVVAQRLYEEGKISYMRTDSVNLSETAITAATKEISSYYGKEYVHVRRFATKTKGAQEAHEAIRPTYMDQHTTDGDNAERRLYELIWKRTIASQMADAELEKTVANISISTVNDELVAHGERLMFDGFLKVYLESSDDEDEEVQKGILPPLMVGEILNLSEMTATERFTQHPPRYAEASLVKKLEELGIGRPSTYAPTISTIQKRGYVTKENRVGTVRKFNTIRLAEGKIKKEVKKENTGAEKAKLFPSDIGVVVNDFLVENFHHVMDYNFTAEVEKEFDEIAMGNVKWVNMLKNFYKPFHKHVEDTLENSERASGERILGNDPVSGKSVHVRIGRFGPMVQLGDSDAEEKPKFAPLRKDQRIETIELGEALELFKLPRTFGDFEDKKLIAGIGRFGPYIRHGTDFYSIKKGDDPNTINEDAAIQLILDKRKADSEKVIKTFAEDEAVQVLNGRYGPYISIGKKNYRIPKGKDPASLSLPECLEIAANQGDSKPSPKKKSKK